mgnify:CR=1 FL=1
MIQIANDEILLLLNEKAFFFNEDGYYTSMSAKEARKKNFKNLFFDRNTREFSYKKPHIFFSNDNSTVHWVTSIEQEAISRAILRLSEGETTKELAEYILFYQDLISQKSYPIQDLKNMIIWKKANKYIFFNNEGVVETLTENKILKSSAINIKVTICGTLYFSDTDNFNSKEFTNGVILKMAYCKMKNGDTIEDLKKYYYNSKFEKKEPLKEIDLFVTKIGQPIFIRVPENPNVNTFDYILVELNLAITWKYDKKQYFAQHKKEINNMVVSKIEKNKQFQKYNVPINILKLARISLKNHRREVQYVFEIKKNNV